MLVPGGLGIYLDIVCQIPADATEQAFAALIRVKGLFVIGLSILPVSADHPRVTGFAIGQLVHTAADTKIRTPQVCIDDQAARCRDAQPAMSDAQAFRHTASGRVVRAVDDIVAVIVPIPRNAVNAFAVCEFGIKDSVAAIIAEGRACGQVHTICRVVAIGRLAAFNGALEAFILLVEDEVDDA